MNHPSPAIVAQRAVKRLPRLALWLFCAAYLLPGFLGRGPWKHDDLSTLGYMAALARGSSDWMTPALGNFSQSDVLLPYWLGAWAMRVAPSWLPLDLAARLPFMGLLVLTLMATWYGTYYLARSPLAQPVSFAFGGEARPTDYARAIADGGLLAFIACLGLAQLSHETTPALAQLCFAALLFYASAALPYRPRAALLVAALGLAGLTLSGAPSMALLLGSGAALIHLLARAEPDTPPSSNKLLAASVLGLSLLCALLASVLDLWRWRIDLPQTDWRQWQSLGRLFLWFTWPTWPLTLWTLWRWRKQWLTLSFNARHIWLPLWFVAIASCATLSTSAAARSLLLALPALAALAAFALPTLGRSVAALIDWFTLIFFSGCALVIWIVWLSMQTGFPAQPASNVLRLAPGFEHHFAFIPWAIALAATLTWAWLVKWRVGRHRAALWKSVVLPAGGAALCWLLLMTLWLPLLDYARSYAPMVQQVSRLMGPAPACLTTQGLTPSQTAAFAWQGRIKLQALPSQSSCDWLIASAQFPSQTGDGSNKLRWQLRGRIGHPANRDESLWLYQAQPD